MTTTKFKKEYDVYKNTPLKVVPMCIVVDSNSHRLKKNTNINAWLIHLFSPNYISVIEVLNYITTGML